MAQADEDAYALLYGDVIGSFVDRGYFVRSMAHNFKRIAADGSCDVDLSVRRLEEVYDYWRDDVARILKDGIRAPTRELDHFKHASVIAFWLRRLIPINTTSVVDRPGPDPDGAEFNRKRLFLRFGNEICALRIGYEICFNYELALRVPKLISGGIRRVDLIRAQEFPLSLMEDFVTILKHKNMSPYSVYLMYKALFVMPPQGVGSQDLGT